MTAGTEPVKDRPVDRLLPYVRLMRWDRPIGILLLLWPTLWALWLASNGRPDVRVTVVFALGVVLMRSAGCVINDYADRDIDPHVRRTRHRPIASGAVSPRASLMLSAGLCIAAFLLVLTLNWLTVGLSAGGALLAATYPFMKRYTYLPQIYLGMAFGWAVPMAFAAQTGGVSDVGWLLFIATVVWTTAYDTMYAMVDREDDMQIGVKSTAILFGDQDRFMIGLLQVLFFIIMLVIGSRMGLGRGFQLGLLVAAGLAVYQQFLIWNRKPQDCFRAFTNNNWFGCAIFLGVVAHYW